MRITKKKKNLQVCLIPTSQFSSFLLPSSYWCILEGHLIKAVSNRVWWEREESFANFFDLWVAWTSHTLASYLATGKSSLSQKDQWQLWG